MNKNDLPQFMTILMKLGTVYAKDIDEFLIELYWQALKEFEWSSVKSAFEKHIMNPDTGQFMPKPADIVRILQGTSQTQGLQAWSKVEKAIREIGVYTTVIFDDALIHAVIFDMGGWVRLCHTSLKELPFRANEFEKRYSGYCLKPPAHYPKQLIGLTAQHNSTLGYDSPIQLIGDTTRAQKVYLNGKEQPAIYHEVSTASLLDVPLLKNEGEENENE